MKIYFKEGAYRDLKKLDVNIRKRILKKLKYYSSQQNFLLYAEKLVDSRLGEYRLRIGDYRVLFDVEGGKIIILKIGHRKDVYKK